MTMGIAYDSSLVSDAPTPSDFSDLTSVLLVVLPCLACYRGEMCCIVNSGPNRLYVRLPALLSSIFAWSRSSTDKKIKTIDRQRAIKQKAVYRLSSPYCMNTSRILLHLSSIDNHSGVHSMFSIDIKYLLGPWKFFSCV